MSVQSFEASVTEFVSAARNALPQVESMNVKAATCYAIGFLSGKQKNEINNAVRVEGDFNDEQWKSVKVPLSQAHRAIAGEYGFGDDLAQMWARKDFRISLAVAYKASKPPVDPEQVIEALVKSLLSLNEEDRNTVISRVGLRINEVTENDTKRPIRFSALIEAVTPKVEA